MSPISDTVLEVKDLKTYFYVRGGELRAVDGLTYTVKKGECVALVGESACGKSVSALSIMRLIPYPPGIIVGGEIIFEKHKFKLMLILVTFLVAMSTISAVSAKPWWVWW